MRVVSKEEFLRWAAEREIGPDPRFEGSQYLMFLRADRNSRFDLPDETFKPVSWLADGKS